jgi:hypothetical protein
VKETSSKSGFAPKAFEMFCALMIGGNGMIPQQFRGYQETKTHAVAGKVTRVTQSDLNNRTKRLGG